ncbi:HEPN domain-containing protein [Aeromonas caviae]
MSVAPNEILDFAKKCMQFEDETSYRSAISRAYYSTYHQVKSSLDNPPGSGGSVHSELINYLSTEAFKREAGLSKRSSIALSYILQTLKTRRARCDYTLSDTVTKSEAVTAIRDAERVFDTCSEVEQLKAS